MSKLERRLSLTQPILDYVFILKYSYNLFLFFFFFFFILFYFSLLPIIIEQEEWTAVTDKTTGGIYWWNKKTGNTTRVGAKKPQSPQGSQNQQKIATSTSTSTTSTTTSTDSNKSAPEDEWTPVVDKASGLSYWWNKKTGETTKVGAPKPISAMKISLPREKNVPNTSIPLTKPIDWVVLQPDKPSTPQKIEQSNAQTAPSKTNDVNNIDEWTAVKEPVSGKIYWWNKKSGQTTALGAPNPQNSGIPKNLAVKSGDNSTLKTTEEKVTQVSKKKYSSEIEAENKVADFDSTPKITLKFQKIVFWDDILSEFVKVHTGHYHEFVATFPGVTVTAILCPDTCNYNITFQSEMFKSHGGLCGVDIIATVYNNEKTRIFTLPKVSPTIDGSEAPRGVVATTTGIVFDLNGGCSGCISVWPTVGTEYPITKITHAPPILVLGLHSHSSTYFHTLHELFPRLDAISGYLKSKFNLSPSQVLVQSRSNPALLNSANEMLDWGFTPNYNDYLRHEKVGSFVTPEFQYFMEAAERIIIPYNRDWYGLLASSRNCVTKKLAEYQPKPESLKCSAVDLPEKYILVITREGERGRTLLNSSKLISFLQDSFEVPVYIPDLKYGCTLVDNIRFFKNAIGFVSTHGAAFTNQNFIQNPAVILQIVPKLPHPFKNPIISLRNAARSLGHQAFIVETTSTKEPRWDMDYNDDILLRLMCNKPPDISLKAVPKSKFMFILMAFKVWEPTKALKQRCYDYLVRLKEICGSDAACYLKPRI